VPDVHCEYRSIAPAFSGLAALKKILAAALDPLDLTQHMLTNHQIDMTEEGPRSRCYFHAQHVRASASGGPNFVVAGVSSDPWRSTGEGWRSRWRSLDVRWTEGNPEVVAR